MKIAIIIRKLNIKGGAQRQTVFLARQLKEFGHQVKIYTFVYAPEKSYNEALSELEVVSLGYYPSGHNYFFNLFLENKAARKLALLIDKDIDILNPHDQVSYRVAYYFKKKMKNIPSVWTMNDLPLKTWSFWRDSQFNPKLKLSLLKKFFYWLVDVYEINKFIKPQDKIVVLDNRDKDWAKQYFKKEALVVRSGLDLEKFSFQERQPLTNKKVKILMTGIFFRHRRFEDGIEALKILKEKKYNIDLSIVGDYNLNEDYYQDLVNLTKKLGVESLVNFVGRVSDEELLKYYQESDIFLFSSHLQSWGLVVFEAMACGLPVIVSKTAGAHEVLTDKETGLLVNPLQPEEIAEALKRLIDEPELYQKLSQQGRRFVQNNISWPKMTQEMIKIFNMFVKKS